MVAFIRTSFFTSMNKFVFSNIDPETQNYFHYYYFTDRPTHNNSPVYPNKKNLSFLHLNLCQTLHKLPLRKFHLITWCGNFVERHQFQHSCEPLKIMRKLCFSAQNYAQTVPFRQKLCENHAFPPETMRKLCLSTQNYVETVPFHKIFTPGGLVKSVSFTFLGCV